MADLVIPRIGKDGVVNCDVPVCKKIQNTNSESQEDVGDAFVHIPEQHEEKPELPPSESCECQNSIDTNAEFVSNHSLPSDKLRFLQCQQTGQRFSKTYRIFDEVKITFSELYAIDLQTIEKQCAIERLSDQTEYRMLASISHFACPGLPKQPAMVPLSQMSYDCERYTCPLIPLRDWIYTHYLTTESLQQAAIQAYIKFAKICRGFVKAATDSAFFS